MKKKLVTIVLACVFALALPCMAFATDSVKGDETMTVGVDDMGNTAALYFKAEGADWVKIEDSDVVAKKYDMDGKNVVAEKSYEITASKENVKVTLVYTTDEDFAGLTCYVFVEHADGTTEKFIREVSADGTVSITMDKLSTVTFSISDEVYDDVYGDKGDNKEKSDTSKGGSTKTAASDSKSTSPKTGVVA